MRQVFYSEGGGCLELTARKVVGADTVLTFKGHLDKYMNRRGMEGYGL